MTAPGEVIRQRYRVERVLGRGGMGEVLLAHDTLLHRRVALKRLRSDGAEADLRRSAVLKEARRASQVSDPRIAAIYDVLELESDVLIVMEYVDGTTLRARMNAPLALSEFWDLATQSLSAVGAAHARGIVHRDIKPENLMITPAGQVKILDFGIARHPDAPEGAVSAPTLTATTMTSEQNAAIIAGTPQYMAPEAVYGGRIDGRTDIFSLGTVFYELITAHNPFAAPTLQGVLERVMTHVPTPASEVNPATPPALAAVIARMMAKDPAQRQASCEEVLRDLDGARVPGVLGQPDGRSTTAAGPAAARRRMALRAGMTVGLLAAVAAVAWGLLRWAQGRALLSDRNLAVLAPVTPAASEDFVPFALGATDVLSRRLQKHQVEPGFQIASFAGGLDDNVRSADEARKVLGVNLALASTLEQRTDVFRARLDLWNTARAKVIASRVIEVPTSQPFQFLDRVYREVAAMLDLTPRPLDAESETGVRGAGTLRFMLRAMGRQLTAKDEPAAERAVEDLELARRAEPEAAAPLAWLSAAQRRCFALSGDRRWLEKAEASARAAVARDSSRAEALRSLGLALLVKNDQMGATVFLARACSLNPTDDATLSALGSAYGRAGRRDLELAVYDSVIARRPHCWQPYWWLANTRYRGGDIEAAIRGYREMVRHAPEFWRGYSNLGGVMVLSGAYVAAIDTLKRSIALRPTKDAFDNLGTAYFNSGRIQEAVDAYNQAFQFGLAEYDSWLNLGDAYYYLHDRQDQAAEAYAQAIRLGREQIASRAQQGRSFNVMIPANLATVFPKLGQPDSARVYLGRALAADSANAVVQYCAALTCWQLGEQDRAIRWLDQAVKAGYPPVAWLRDSPIFKEWNKRQEFRGLLARAGAQSPSPGAP
jgi:serine/threonine-protein kinase